MPPRSPQIYVAGDLHIHLGPSATDVVQPILAALAHTQGVLVSEVDDRLAALSAQFDTFRADLDRELTDFGAKVAGTLTADQQAAFDALAAKFTAAQAAVDAADPAPAV